MATNRCMRKLVATAMFSGGSDAQKWHAIRSAAPVLVAAGLALMAVLVYGGALSLLVAACGLLAGFSIVCSYVCLFAGSHALYLLGVPAILIPAVSISVHLSQPISLWLLLLNLSTGAFVVIGLGTVAITKYFERWR